MSCFLSFLFLQGEALGGIQCIWNEWSEKSMANRHLTENVSVNWEHAGGVKESSEAVS